MITSSVTVRDNGRLANITRIARQFRGGVYVGYFGNLTHTGKRPITLGDLASIHEHGKGHNPQLAFVLPALQKNRQSYLQLVARQISPVLQGRTPVANVWRLVGTKAMADVQNYMITASFTPLKPATIKKKGSSKPLIDTGQLRQSVTYKVK